MSRRRMVGVNRGARNCSCAPCPLRAPPSGYCIRSGTLGTAQRSAPRGRFRRTLQMTAHAPGVVRAVALVGPTGGGKTSLMEAMLIAAGARAPRSGGQGAMVGDSSPEAKARGHSVELNLASFDFMDDHYAVVDCPGAVDFAAESDFALPAVDLAVVVAAPDAAKAILLQPTLKELERLGVPRIIFVNKMDQARPPLGDLLEALSAVSESPVVARQLPVWSGEQVTGYVDLALERAYA